MKRAELHVGVAKEVATSVPPGFPPVSDTLPAAPGTLPPVPPVPPVPAIPGILPSVPPVPPVPAIPGIPPPEPAIPGIPPPVIIALGIQITPDNLLKVRLLVSDLLTVQNKILKISALAAGTALSQKKLEEAWKLLGALHARQKELFIALEAHGVSM
jgi:hypothetical protein